jgi:pyruvate carboxylase
MSGMTSQPCLNSLAAALRHTQRDGGLNQDALDLLSDYWPAVRELYYPFEQGLKAPSADVYRHEMPGGQFTNLRQQAKSLGLEGKWREIAEAYASANRLLGDIVKVTPSSKVVGDLALFMVTNNLSPGDLAAAKTPLSYPRSVVEMLQRMLGEPLEVGRSRFRTPCSDRLRRPRFNASQRLTPRTQITLERRCRGRFPRSPLIKETRSRKGTGLSIEAMKMETAVYSPRRAVIATCW